MTLLHLLGAPGDGGAETYFVALIEALHRAEYAQAAATRPWPSRDEALRSLGVPVANFPFTPATSLLSRIGVAGFARKVDAKVLVSWMSRAAGAAPRGPWARIGRLGGYYDLKYFKGHDVLVGNTPDIMRHITEDGWPADRALYIPNFAKADDSAAISRATFDTPDGVPLFLGMGRLHSDKAHDITLRALALMPDAWLWIAGSGSARRRTEGAGGGAGRGGPGAISGLAAGRRGALPSGGCVPVPLARRTPRQCGDPGLGLRPAHCGGVVQGPRQPDPQRRERSARSNGKRRSPGRRGL